MQNNLLIIQQVDYVQKRILKKSGMPWKVMSLSHTILMLLAEGAHSGYDLSKEFDECVGHYWQATPQQIYRELGKLDDRGLV
ncbi:MAG: PadR family transcriptional regulator, partial [Cyanobacteria bacterium J06648_11]